MKLYTRFKKLNTWNKLFVIVAILTILGIIFEVAIYFLDKDSCTIITQNNYYECNKPSDEPINGKIELDEELSSVLLCPTLPKVYQFDYKKGKIIKGYLYDGCDSEKMDFSYNEFTIPVWVYPLFKNDSKPHFLFDIFNKNNNNFLSLSFKRYNLINLKVKTNKGLYDIDINTDGTFVNRWVFIIVGVNKENITFAADNGVDMKIFEIPFEKEDSFDFRSSTRYIGSDRNLLNQAHSILSYTVLKDSFQNQNSY